MLWWTNITLLQSLQDLTSYFIVAGRQQSVFRTLQEQPPEVFYKKRVFKNFTKLTRKHLCQSLFFNKVPGLRPATLLKKRFRHRYFPVNFAKLLRTPFLQNISGRLLFTLPNIYDRDFWQKALRDEIR